MPIIWALGQGALPLSLPQEAPGTVPDWLTLSNRVRRQLRDGQVLLDKFVGHVMEHPLSAR